MPLLIRDYNWEQNNEFIYITIPLKGVKSDNVDIVITDGYVKLSFPPYLFEVALYKQINGTSASVIINKNGCVCLKLPKIEEQQWEQLASDIQKNKYQMDAFRQKALTDYTQMLLTQDTHKKEQKQVGQKFALSEQMKMEELERKNVENTKANIKNMAMMEFQNWKEVQSTLKSDTCCAGSGLPNSDSAIKRESHTKPAIPVVQTSEHKVSTVKHDQVQTSDRKTVTSQSPMTEVRNSGKISVKFTPRVFPTAARESQHDQEQEWLRKQAEARRITDEQLSDEIREIEKNPLLLQEKGLLFYQQGNYLAAVAVFNHAIRLNPKMSSLYNNRALCHMQLGNLIKCIEDSSMALDLLTPPVESNAKSRVQAHVRRGTAFCKLKLYPEGLLDYEAAAKIDPKSQQLLTDCDNIRKFIQHSVGEKEA